MAALSVRIYSQLESIPESAWNSLLTPDDNPLMDWRWLAALELSGCAVPETGWTPCHLTLWRGTSLIGAAPAYIKQDSDGDFSRDWDWAAAAMRAQLPYYPKLVIGVPFTPVTGRRILVAPGEDEAAVLAVMLQAAQQLVAQENLGSLHVLFPTAQQAAQLSAAGLAKRIGFQYHFHNPGYRNSDEFYGRFSSKKRNTLKREQAAAAGQGITIRTVYGDEIAQAPERWADTAHLLHRSTVDKLMWGRRWLNQDFYRRVFASMPAAMEVVVAERAGSLVAGAFNVAAPGRLFGRYWGCLEEHPFLHFNVCYYHSIGECIARGVRLFEGGAGGEHKIARGFEPSLTYSCHGFSHPRLDEALRRHLQHEAAQREAALQNWHTETPVLKPLQPRQPAAPAPASQDDRSKGGPHGEA